MRKLRLRFSKTGPAVYISHLDLMRTFQRSFLRGELPVRHTEGFNPHAFVSIALPLSVGYSSGCELLDFDLEDETPPERVPGRLGPVLPEGIVVTGCYAPARPFREIFCALWELELLYDNGIPQGAAAGLCELFSRPGLMVAKKSKKGKGAGRELETDISPLIHELTCRMGEGSLLITAVLRAQEPGLNPRYLIRAVETHCPDLKPDFFRCRRVAVLDRELRPFA